MTRSVWIAVLALGSIATSAAAQSPRPAAEWCNDNGRSDSPRHCDVREYTLAAAPLNVDAGPNGGVRIVGWNKAETLVRARVAATATTEAEAKRLADAVTVTTANGQVRADGPARAKGEPRSGWYVSYEIWTPARSDVSAKTTNGGISFTGVSGRLAFDATNGGVTLERVGGDVRGSTVNGGLTVELAGDRWEGAGLDVRTTNGGVKVKVPEGYSCALAVATVNGGLKFDFPITTQGETGRGNRGLTGRGRVSRIETQLGSGGSPVRIETTNGGVTLSR